MSRAAGRGEARPATPSSQVEIRLLGLVEADVGGHPLALGGAKQRALLALLALHVGERVSTDMLIDGLWGERSPPSAPKMVQLYVSQLRKLLEGAGAGIVTRGRGYDLHMPADAVDAKRFEALVARAERGGGDPGAAAERSRCGAVRRSTTSPTHPSRHRRRAGSRSSGSARGDRRTSSRSTTRSRPGATASSSRATCGRSWR